MSTADSRQRDIYFNDVYMERGFTGLGEKRMTEGQAEKTEDKKSQTEEVRIESRKGREENRQAEG